MKLTVRKELTGMGRISELLATAQSEKAQPNAQCCCLYSVRSCRQLLVMAMELKKNTEI